ncbi:MAG: putative sulfate/molybdate transporter [Candidatus Limnocylindria bacterium]
MSRAGEVAGAFGDVGVFLPLAIGLIAVNGLDATALFGLAGVYYVVSGLLYRLPVPVQPFKAVSAIAMAQSLSAGTIHAAALVIGSTLLVLSFGRLPALIERVFAIPVIRGIQLGLGALLLSTGLTLAERDPRLGAIEWAPAVALICGLLVVAALQRQHRVPALFPIAAAGVAWGAATLSAGVAELELGPSLAASPLPSSGELLTGLVVLALPQIPLTIGNSVVATSDVARAYFGARAARLRPAMLLRDMGIANLLTGLAGGMPMCHGAGGMTAHVRFGARTALAPLTIGVVYLAAAIGLGRAVPVLVDLFPSSILGVLVGYVGWQHLLLARSVRRLEDRIVVAGIGILTVVTGSLALGCAAGLGAYWLVRLTRRDGAVATRRVAIGTDGG